MNIMFRIGYMLLTLAIAGIAFYLYYFLKRNQVKESDIDEKQEKEVNERFKEKGIKVEPLKPEVKNIKEIEPIKEKVEKHMKKSFLKKIFKIKKKVGLELPDLDVSPLPPPSLIKKKIDKKHKPKKKKGKR